MSADPSRIAAIFAAALARSSAEERAAYLDKACGNEPELRRRVEALLQAHADADGSQDQPVLTTDAPAGQWIDRDAPLPLTERPGMHVGRYKLLQQIGEGGMGAVYMAEQEQPVRRRVALKIIKPGMDSAQVVARFEAERQALAMMDHPNIARVLDGGTTDSGRPYFVMELVYGVPITKFCDDSQLTPRQRLELFVPICHAIQHAHQKGIIHRDIKPSNVLVTMHDDKPVPKVIDFGVAKAVEQRLTEKSLFTAFGAVVGTLEYMSPEQAEMNALGVDTRSDVYSLGALLYELLTGSTPLERKRLREAAYTEVLRLIKEVDPPRPSLRLSSSGDLPKIAAARRMEATRLSRLLRGEIDWIVMRCLEKDRTRRYESASALARDVERYLHDEAVEACPPSVAYRLRKFARKYRMILSTAAAFVLLLLIAVGVSIGLAVEAKRAAGEAKYSEAIADERREAAHKAQSELIEERDRAQKEWRRAEEAAKLAKANAAETGRALDRMTVAKGIQLADEGNLFAALSWFVRPLERGGLTAEEEHVHRTRIACYLRHTPGRPTLRHMFFFGTQDNEDPKLAFSADGKRLLAVADDVVYVWDLQRCEQLAALEDLGVVNTAKFSPDGARLLTCSEDAIVQTWDAASGERLEDPFVDWGGLLHRPLALLPSSGWQFLGSVGADSAVSRAGRADFPSALTSAEFSADTHRALFAFPTVFRLFDLETHELIGQWPTLSESDVQKLNSDGRSLLHLRNGVAWVHDVSTGKVSSRSLDHGSGVGAVLFSPDGTRALTLGNEAAQIWDARTWRPLTRIGLTDATKPRFGPDSAKFSLDNRLLACWSRYYGSLAWWSVASGQFVGEAPDIANDFSGFDWRPDGQQLVRVSQANTGEITVWDAAADWQKATVLPHVGVAQAVYAPDGKTLATVGWNGVICIWDFCNRFDAFAWQAPEEDVFDSDMRLKHHISRSAWSDSNKVTVVLRTLAGTKQFSWLDPRRFLPPGESFNVGAVSPDRSRVITHHGGPDSSDGNGDEFLKLWDATTRQAIGKPLALESGHCTWVAFSPDSRLAAVASDEGVARLWDVRTGELFGKPLKHGGTVYMAAFSPDGQLLVTCSADSTARLWFTKTCEPASDALHHGDRVTSAAFAPKGNMIATASLDGAVRFWKLATGTAAGIVELTSGFAWDLSSPLSVVMYRFGGIVDLKPGFAWDLAFHPNGSFLLVSYANPKDRDFTSVGFTKVYDIASLQEIFPEVKGYSRDNRPQFRLRKDGRVAFGAFDRRTWDLTPEPRPARDLIRLVQLYTQRRLDAGGGQVPLSKQDLQSLREELRAKYPQEFSVSAQATVSWREKRFRSVGIDRPVELAFHRRWLAAELAEAGWQPGVRGNEDMEIDDYWNRLQALAIHGRHVEAAAAADALVARWPTDSDSLYQCACVHALAAGAVKGDAAQVERYALRAVALLRQAAAAGYNDGLHILKDPDLNALRGRRDFLDFLWDLAESPGRADDS